MIWIERTPNPGSDAALAQGCICAVLDNCYGKFAPWPPDGWYITAGCPVHAAGHSEPIDDVNILDDTVQV
jgi:hypothetical protein